MSLTGSTNAEKIWNFCKSKGINDYGCAGVLGNMDCESGLNPKNLEDQYEKNSVYTDETYIAAVDSGRYTNFVNDAWGFGLAQWTWWSRKQELLNYAKSCGASIGDLEMQLNFFMKELVEKFPGVLNTLKTATSVLQASNAMLLEFECPFDSGTSVQVFRASCSQKYYDRFVVKTVEVKYNMGYTTVKKGSSTKLSEHFNSNELDCHGSGCCTETTINERLVEYLEKIRVHFGKPVQITSGYRCIRHNSVIGGATGSRHTKADAADIVVSGIAPREVAKYAESIGIKGIGLYETAADGFFVHIDTRDTKSFWYGQACAARSTFGGVVANATTQTTATITSVSVNKVLSLGSTGDAVKSLQNNLVKLGYDIVPDGVYGNLTMAAVMEYQKKCGLTADGIVGDITHKSIADSVNKSTPNAFKPYTVNVNANILNVRKGAGTNYPVVGTVKNKSVYTIVEESTGIGASKWGKLSNGFGWISLDYCIKS